MSPSATVLGALTVALALGGVSAQVTEAHSTCTITASGYTDKDVSDTRAEAVNYAHAYVCGDDKEIDAPAVAVATAEAFAKAVASVVIDCKVKGAGSASASGYAKAVEKANAWLEAYAGSWASAEVCDGCYAVTDVVVEVTEDVFLKAVAVAKAKIEDYYSDDSNADSGKLHADDIKVDIEKASVTAISEAFAAAKKDVDDTKCIANGGVAVSTPSNFAACVAEGVGIAKTEANDAVSFIKAYANQVDCKKSKKPAEFEFLNQDIANAVAKAIAKANSACIVVGKGGYACAASDADIEASVSATVEAFAEVWAGANTCGCKVATDADISSLGSILAEAAAEAWSEVCPGDVEGKFFFDYDVYVDVDKSEFYARALSTAIINVLTNGDDCELVVDLETSVCECVTGTGSKAVCKEEHDDRVLACCGENDVCVQNRRNTEGTCRRANSGNADRVLTESCLGH